jgi:hypothetical protein
MGKEPIFPTDVETSKHFALILYAAKQLDAERGEDQNANSNETRHEANQSPFGRKCLPSRHCLWITFDYP